MNDAIGLTPESVLLVAVLLPLATAVAVVAFGRWPNLREGATLSGGAVTLALVAGILLPAVRGGGRPRIDLFEILPGLQVSLHGEPLGLIFALVASSLWIVTSLFAVGYLRGHHSPNQTRFFTFFALAIFGALGVALSANLLTLFLFYELITLCTFPLVTHDGTERAKKAGRLYLGLLMSTSVGLMLPAVIWIWNTTGTLEFRPGGILQGHVAGGSAAVLLALFAFGTAKAALMPVHRWLPAAMVAPTPVSALLHAVAVVKAGVFTLTKVVVYVFGLDLLSTGAARPIQWIAAFTLLAASVVALYQDNLKRRLAYSTISQLAYIVLGATLAAPKALVGAGLHIVMHAFGKITLFFCAGAIYVHAHKTNLRQMHGLGRRMPVTFMAFFLGSLSVIGVPPLGGSWSKLWLGSGAAQGDEPWAVAVYMLASLLAIGYLMPVVARGFFGEPSPDDAFCRDQDINEASPLLSLPPAFTALCCLALFVFAGELADFLGGMLGAPTSTAIGAP
ncbi:MAG: monovalent cation/H+ antiporter subunit D family protein [Thermoanaerobaculia bacterium]|nr:monovalent cation/H+ antiporter subunit D family protein [Thermoanaerobaculia bacterium]